VPERQFTEAEVEAAIQALSDRDRFREAEQRVAQIAPQLQKILAGALAEGGWFDEAHESQVLKAATTPDDEERLTAVRTLLAEETRLGMLVGVTVGWELARELENIGTRPQGD
jgi:Lon protease-like protein